MIRKSCVMMLLLLVIYAPIARDEAQKVSLVMLLLLRRGRSKGGIGEREREAAAAKIGRVIAAIARTPFIRRGAVIITIAPY